MLRVCCDSHLGFRVGDWLREELKRIMLMRVAENVGGLVEDSAGKVGSDLKREEDVGRPKA